MLTRLREFGPAIITWPINSEPVLERVVEAGVDGIISDRLSILSIAARRYRTEVI
jgi:glycerophosphoryl diester phosphodiesterase